MLLQGEGDEQGCPLMPALFALARHDAPREASRDSLPAKSTFSTTCTSSRHARGRRTPSERSPVKLNATRACARTWSDCGLRAVVAGAHHLKWQTSARPSGWRTTRRTRTYIVVFGTPLGGRAFAEQHANVRATPEHHSIDQLLKLSDLQCSWVLLSQAAMPRANHKVRMWPPKRSARYAFA